MFDWQEFVQKAPQVSPFPTQPTGPGGLPHVPFVPGVGAPGGLDQSELIDYRELAELSARLTKRKSEKHQQIGRAIAKALRGEPYCPTAPGVRNALLFQIAGEIIEAFPYCNPGPIADAFSGSLTRMAEDAQPGNPAPTVAEFVGMLNRHQGPKQQKHVAGLAIENVYQAAVATMAPRPEDPTAPLDPDAPAVTPLDPAAWAGDATVSGALEAGLDLRSVIVAVDEGNYYVRHPLGRVYPFRCASKEALRLTLQRQFLDRGGLGLVLVDDRGDMYPSDQILRSYASPAKHQVFDYGATQTEFDPRAGVLRSGFTMGVLPDITTVDAAIDEAVEAWLIELAGGTEEGLADLYDWIAATDQRHINTNAAALVIQGAPSIGKSAFARALAYTWGKYEPSKFGYVLDRFNGALAECPIWHADETIPEELSDSRFKEIVQEQRRHIELKGRERMYLIGCARILITINEMSDLRIKGSGGPDGVKACADRLAIYQARSAHAELALDALRRHAGAMRPDLPVLHAERLVIAQHLRWVQLNVTPRGQRFLGARLSNHTATTAILRATASGQPKLFEVLADYFQDPWSWEKEYTPVESLAFPGRRFPLVVDKEIVYANVQELMLRCGLRDGERRYVDRALDPFRRSYQKHRLSFGQEPMRLRAYYIELDAERLELALDADAVPALLHGTRARMHAAGLHY